MRIESEVDKSSLKQLLDECYYMYNTISFIEKDPVSIPHGFSKKEDVEISAFLTAVIAWGQRKTILNNACKLMNLMDSAPYDFVIHHQATDLKRIEKYLHRTFNGCDCICFIKALRRVYVKYGGMEQVFKQALMASDTNLYSGIMALRKIFFEAKHQPRSQKHFADPSRNSSCKRINMFLRWMVRKDNHGVDFGLWDIPSALLLCPLDVHSGRVARQLGLLNRRQDDWKAVLELTDALREFDPADPVKYDFALFGMGAYLGKNNITPAIEKN